MCPCDQGCAYAIEGCQRISGVVSRKLLTNIRSHTIVFLYYLMAVLVAVSIPIFTNQLEKAREATDISNMRAAYAIAATDILTRDYSKYSGTLGTDGTGTLTGYYDVKNSDIVKTKPTDPCIKAKVNGLQTAAIDWPSNATFTYSGNPSTTNGIKITLEIKATGDTIRVEDAA